jgi:hypothetical protein
MRSFGCRGNGDWRTGRLDSREPGPFCRAPACGRRGCGGYRDCGLVSGMDGLHVFRIKRAWVALLSDHPVFDWGMELRWIPGRALDMAKRGCMAHGPCAARRGPRVRGPTDGAVRVRWGLVSCRCDGGRPPAIIKNGGMAEWLKAAVLKTVNGVTRSGVRIPLPPPDSGKISLGTVLWDLPKMAAAPEELRP